MGPAPQPGLRKLSLGLITSFSDAALFGGKWRAAGLVGLQGAPHRASLRETRPEQPGSEQPAAPASAAFSGSAGRPREKRAKARSAKRSCCCAESESRCSSRISAREAVSRWLL